MSPEILRLHASIAHFEAMGAWLMASLLREKLREVLNVK